MLEVADGKLTGTVGKPIVDSATKLATLSEAMPELGLAREATLAVGDGANDLAMIRAAGLGVAYHAKPIVAAAAGARIDHGDLTALLWAQGIARRIGWWTSDRHPMPSSRGAGSLAGGELRQRLGPAFAGMTV